MENNFITYKDALQIIAKNTANLGNEKKKIEDCVGAYLAENIIADRDFPPFNRATMDGIAIAYDAFSKGQNEFFIESIAPAGSPQATLKNKQHCIEIMTGAIMPFGADTVIRYEEVELIDDKAIIQVDHINQGQNVHLKGYDIAKETVIVDKKKRLSSIEINLAASVGKANILVKKMPRAVIFSTGDELVPINKTPKSYQIRRSNSYGIQASLKEWGISSDLKHLPDQKDEMLVTIAGLLPAYDLFIFSGGVSKGKFDYLPEVLTDLKIKKQFYKVQQRPGKPLWFGTTENGKTIFALPGNPVSSIVCVYMYVKFWLQKSLGLQEEILYVTLKKEVAFKPNLVYFLEATLESTNNGKLVAEPVKGNGSGDFANLAKTDGFLILPQHKSYFSKNEVYPFVCYRSKW